MAKSKIKTPPNFVKIYLRSEQNLKRLVRFIATNSYIKFLARHYRISTCSFCKRVDDE